jgi:hypothetical protein
VRIHSDFIEAADIRKAARFAGVGFTRFDLKGSRSREAAFDILLTGDSGRRQNGGEDEAASWDQWGIVLGHLHRLDPNLKTPYYEGGDHFIWATGGRYTEDFTAIDCHRQHLWGLNRTATTGSYYVTECERGKNPCGAIQRRMRHGRDFADLNR